MSPTDPVWEELGKIDYLLDQMARAVERGELDADSWDRLSPRYWERRTELAAVLQNRAARYAGAVQAARPPESAAQASAASAASPTPSPAPAATAAAGVAAGPGLPPAPVPGGDVPPTRPTPAPGVAPAAVRTSPARHLTAGAWMSYAGALLVVIAVAIFTLYAWATFTPAVKLAVLLAVTAAFYVAGELIRVRLDLPAAGVALISVGSAMLLFDGWSVIRATGAQGAWPWAIVLLVCSLAYWATEWRIAGGWFGAIGAAAQVGWWWMLGSALRWEPYWVAAGVSCVAVLWVLASERVRRDGPLGALGSVLRSGAALVAVGTALAGIATSVAAQLGGRPVFWPVAAAAVISLAFTVVVERLSPRSYGVSALGHAPLFIAAAAYWLAADLSGASGPGPALLVTFAVMAIAYDAYAPWRGSWTYAIAGLAAESAFWLALADRFSWRGDVTVGVLAAFGLSAMVAARLLERARLAPERWRGAAPTARVWAWGGVAILSIATLCVPSLGRVPLTGVRVTGGDALLAAGVMLAWMLGSRVRRSAALGRVALGWSFYALAASLAWAFPGWHSAWYGAGLLALAVLYAQGREIIARLLRVDGDETLLWTRALYVVIVLLAIAGSVAYFRLDSYPVAALLGIAAVAWAADGLATREWATLLPAAAAFVAAIGTTGWVAVDLPTAAVWATAAALLPGGIGLFGPRRPGAWGSFMAIGSALAGSMMAVAAWGGEWRLAIAFLLAGCAWGFVAEDAALPEVWALAAAFGSFGLLAALSWGDAAPALTVGALAVSAGLLFVPRALTRSSAGSPALRRVRALAAAGALVLVELWVAGMLSRAFGDAAGFPRWLDIGATGGALSFVLLGAYVIAWSSLERFEIGLYPGAGLIVLGAMVQMDAWKLRDSEWFLVLAALYFVAMGLLWASRKPGRSVPTGTDIAAFAVGVALPLALAVGAYSPEAALRHGLWALGLAAVSVSAGLLTHTKVYFQGGIAVLVLDALWLSRSVLLGLPSWVWIGSIGLALIVGGVLFARREQLGGVGRRIREGFADWR